MPLGNKKGHISGRSVRGTHTSVIDGADAVLKALSVMEWFVSARPREIVVDRGGSLSVTIKRHANAAYRNTLTLTFRKAGTVQKIDMVAQALEENRAAILNDIKSTVARRMRGAALYDRVE